MLRVKLLAHNAADDEVLGLCYEWLDLVAADRFQEALDLLWVPPTYEESQHWTPGSLRSYIENYGWWTPREDDTRWHVTPAVDAVDGPDEPSTIGRLDDDPHSGWVDLDLPLNGSWSDLTAQFEFTRMPGGTAVSLYDIHVL
jgi:hypothetical protein